MAMHCSFEFVWNLAEGLVLHSFLHEDFIREKDDLSRLTHCPLYFVSSPLPPPTSHIRTKQHCASFATLLTSHWHHISLSTGALRKSL